MPKAYFNKTRFQCDVRYSLREGEKKRKKSFYGKTEKEAEKKANVFLFELERGDYLEERKDSLINFLNEYWEICSNKWEDTTRSLYKMYIDTHFKPYFKDALLKDIKPITLDKFYNYKLNNEENKVKPMGINTVRKLNGFLKSAFKYAVKNDYIKKNPADNVILAKKEKYTPTVYNEEQFGKLLETVKKTDDEIPIALGAGCGLRRGEVFGLIWKNIDFKNKTISIETTAVRFDKNLEKKPKNVTSKRVLIAPDYVIDILQSYYNIHKPNINEKVITRWIPQSYSERFRNLLKNHNLEHIRFHDLRHFNAVAMLKYGVSDKVAAERLGHSQVGTLKNIYQHVLKEMDETAANQINSIFK
ncbi:tyrosine-type recombinase/integrase [Anaerosacchariphilus polymeriproducens]|uniref:Site-specific integrase n=1 Tax=Anaerosacchariphilus polymeriproducens TaxID=1812858 RepID=A0A371AYY9_9FIRM|nr:site-specific integrase [Anaerosacchariphilus polymeriproducens]RDU24766.1 site-specific integrase [Anaerosacchariphilus polymeriproducens]